MDGDEIWLLPVFVILCVVFPYFLFPPTKACSCVAVDIRGGFGHIYEDLFLFCSVYAANE